MKKLLILATGLLSILSYDYGHCAACEDEEGIKKSAVQQAKPSILSRLEKITEDMSDVNRADFMRLIFRIHEKSGKDSAISDLLSKIEKDSRWSRRHLLTLWRSSGNS